MKRPSWHTEPERDPDNPSKSQVKRDLKALQDLALRLPEIPAPALEALVGDERLRDAILELRRLSNPSARRRQGQYVAKLLEGTDVEALRRALGDRHLRKPRP